jgi:hypothetical protein
MHRLLGLDKVWFYLHNYITKEADMKKLGVILILLLFFSVPAQAWERIYGGSDWDWGYSVQQTSDGGYIIAGETQSFGAGGCDVYLIKTDASGDSIWTRTYGSSNWEHGRSVQQTSDEGYIIAGWTYPFGAGDVDVYLIKTDASGDTIWTRTYGGSDADVARSVQQTSDGGYIIAGLTNSFGAGNDDVYLIKTDASGDTIWTRTYGGSGDDEGNSVCETSDGGYIIAGKTESFGAGRNDVYLIKTDVSGDTIWTRTYGGSDWDWGYSVQQTSDGGYIIAGWTYPFGAGSWDVYLIKTDASGDTIWTRTYGGSDWEYGYSVQQTSDGGYIIAGLTCSFGAGWTDVYLIKTDASGDTIWTRTYGCSKADEGHSVQQTSDGGYIITGKTWSFDDGPGDVYLIKTDADGNSAGVEEAKETRSAPGLLLEVRSPSEDKLDLSFFLPSSGLARVELFDAAGKRVGVIEDGGRQAGWHHITRPLSLPRGVYFVQLSATLGEGYKLSRSNITQKVILLGN